MKTFVTRVLLVKRNIAQTIGMRFLPMWLKRRLYFDTVHSRLHCCLLVCGVTSRTNMKKLFLIQKKITRFIQNLSS
ncbi:MAG: hypothetical protein PV344_03755, partial [Anaplasma sp.]|nr:hypothetical protein [Anaplasma sp.]